MSDKVNHTECGLVASLAKSTLHQPPIMAPMLLVLYGGRKIRPYRSAKKKKNGQNLLIGASLARAFSYARTVILRAAGCCIAVYFPIYISVDFFLILLPWKNNRP